MLQLARMLYESSKVSAATRMLYYVGFVTTLVLLTVCVSTQLRERDKINAERKRAEVIQFQLISAQEAAPKDQSEKTTTLREGHLRHIENPHEDSSRGGCSGVVSVQVGHAPPLCPTWRKTVDNAGYSKLLPTIDFAIVVPFHDLLELERIQVSWSLHPPCNPQENTDDKVDVILFGPEVIKNELPEFGCLRYVSQLNKYAQEAYQIGAPCAFFDMMLNARWIRQYRIVLQMETDSIPLVSSWLKSLQLHAASMGDDQWISGACGFDNRVCNGNAFYNVVSYVPIVEKYFHWWGTHAPPNDLAFDSNLPIFFETQASGYKQGVLRTTHLLKNCGMAKLQKCFSGIGSNAPVIAHSRFWSKEATKLKEQLDAALLELSSSKNIL